MQTLNSDLSTCSSIPEIKEYFNIISKIGEGTFSNVFLANLKRNPNSQLIALKFIIPTSHPSRTANELKCLKNLGGKKNVIGLLFATRHGDFIALGMPYFPHDNFMDYFDNLNPDEISDYIKNLLTALSHVHSHNIIHRDIKPSNFLYNRQQRRYSLVDFGLCQKDNENNNIKTKKYDENSISLNTRTKRRLEMTPEKNNPCAKRITLSPITSKYNIKQEKNTEETITKPLNTIGFTRLDLNHNSAENLKISSLDRNTQSKKDNTNLIIKSTVKSLKFSRNVCYCYGKSKVCSICLSRKNSCAPRAGTPGFRAPEVLLRCLHQTTAIDIWSAGVIFLSLLSGCFPFFVAKDDMAALAEIITLFGSNAMREAAIKMNLQLTTSPFKPALDTRKICKRFKSIQPVNQNLVKCVKCGYKLVDDDCVCLKGDEQSFDSDFTESAFNLLHQMLNLDTNCRISAATALYHPYLTCDSRKIVVDSYVIMSFKDFRNE